MMKICELVMCPNTFLTDCIPKQFLITCDSDIVFIAYFICSFYFKPDFFKHRRHTVVQLLKLCALFKITELVQSSQGGVYFFQLNSC